MFIPTRCVAIGHVAFHGALVEHDDWLQKEEMAEGRPHLEIVTTRVDSGGDREGRGLGSQ